MAIDSLRLIVLGAIAKCSAELHGVIAPNGTPVTLAPEELAELVRCAEDLPKERRLIARLEEMNTKLTIRAANAERALAESTRTRPRTAAGV